MYRERGRLRLKFPNYFSKCFLFKTYLPYLLEPSWPVDIFCSFCSIPLCPFIVEFANKENYF